MPPESGQIAEGGRTIRSPLRLLCHIALVAIVVTYLFQELWPISRLPQSDYWGFFPRVIDPSSSESFLGRILARNNEHLIIVPKLFQYLNYLLTHGSNFGLLGLNLFLTGITPFLITRLMPRECRGSLAVSFLALALLFSPAPVQNWHFGFGGLAMASCDGFLIASILSLCAGFRRGSPRLFALGVALSVLSACSATEGVFALLILTFALPVAELVLTKRLRYSFFYALVAAVFVGIWSLSFRGSAPQHPAMTFSTLQILFFALTFLGGPMAAWISSDGFSLDVAHAYGLVGIAFLAWISVRSLRGRKDLVPWVLLGLFGLGTAFGTAVGRQGFGEHSALSSRYYSVPILFWLALALASLQLGSRKIRGVLVVFWLIFALYPMHRTTEASKGRYFRNIAAHPAVELGLRMGIFDAGLINPGVTPAVAELEGALPILKQTRHVPFDVQNGPETQIGTLVLPQPSEVVAMTTHQMSYLSGGMRDAIRIEGSYPAGQKPHSLWVIDQERHVVGVGVADLTTSDAGFWKAYVPGQTLAAGAKIIGALSNGDLIQYGPALPLLQNPAPVAKSPLTPRSTP